MTNCRNILIKSGRRCDRSDRRLSNQWETKLVK
ncbi:hypothetical protein M5D96_004536 [Drosophila gunungcola]|uniref:Uncharacterized protein n=1 Tax=Drosophila gunungcola TaxID=103775 RepID=A0A9P9YU62_9MUSC|nr:hypothetical protein M5D96_004536 [Drosophila gunungcola]